LKWTKTRDNVEGDTLPAGEECYPCFDCRRRYFLEEDENGQTRTPSMHKLLDMRRDYALGTKFLLYRRDRVSGANECKNDEKINVTRAVVTSKRHYNDRYQEGTEHPLKVYIEMRHEQHLVDTSDEEAMSAYLVALGKQVRGRISSVCLLFRFVSPGHARRPPASPFTPCPA